MSSGSDVVALAVASLVVGAPGAALLLALGVRRPLWWVALSPPASVGVATLTAMASAALGLRFGPPTLAAATALLATAGLLRLRLDPHRPQLGAGEGQGAGGLWARLRPSGRGLGPSIEVPAAIGGDDRMPEPRRARRGGRLPAGLGRASDRLHALLRLPGLGLASPAPAPAPPGEGIGSDPVPGLDVGAPVQVAPGEGVGSDAVTGLGVGAPVQVRAGEGPRGGGLGVRWRRLVPVPAGWGRYGERMPGVVLVLAGVGLSVLVWTYGLGSMATVGQEHDLIVHSVLTAYIQQTGHGAPWQLMPADVLTGQGVMFYPAGLHLLMAVTASVTGSTAVGVNAVSTVVLGAGWSSGSASLAYVAARRARLEASPALVAAGMAAVVAAGLYRPTIALVQWGGTVPNAATLALTPGLLAALLTLPSLAAGWRSAVGPAAAVGVAVAGMLAIHPSAVVTVGVSAVAWWAGEALTGDGRRRLLGQIVPLAAAGFVAAAVAAPMLLAMSRVAAHIGAFQPDIDPLGVGDALDRTLRLTYNVGDPRQKLAVAQWAAAGLALVGAAVSLATRRALGAVVAWLAWVVIVVATWVRPGQGVPGLLTNVFYDAQIRVWSHASLFVPTLAGLAVALLATAIATHAEPRRRLRRVARPGSRFRPGAALALTAHHGNGNGNAPVLLAAEPDATRPLLAPAVDRARLWPRSGRGRAGAETVEPDIARHPKVGPKTERVRMWPWSGRGRIGVVVHRPNGASEVGAAAVPGKAAGGVCPDGDVGDPAAWQGRGWRQRVAGAVVVGRVSGVTETSDAAVPGLADRGVSRAGDAVGGAEPRPTGPPDERRAWARLWRRIVAAAVRARGRVEVAIPAASGLLAVDQAPVGGPVQPSRGRPRRWSRSRRLAEGRTDEGAVAAEVPGTDGAGVTGGARWSRWGAAAVGGVMALGYLVGPGYRYSRTDVEALASRYARPEYTRVSAGDQEAVDWLADQVAPGERVLNSADDGSTLLYVDRRVPIVNVASLGSVAEPASYRLLQRFNRYPDDPEVRRMLRDLDVRWVYVDSSAPTISASGAPEAWVAGNWLSVPEGLRHLAGLPGLERRFRSGTVSIYHLDPAVLG